MRSRRGPRGQAEFQASLKLGLTPPRRPDPAKKAEKIEALQARIAQLTLELDRLQPAKAMKPRKERG